MINKRPKIRKALDKIFMQPPPTLVKLIRSTIGDDSIRPGQVKNALGRLWARTSDVEIPQPRDVVESMFTPERKRLRGKELSEEHHIAGKPQGVVELFRTIDKFCRELDPAAVCRKYLAKYIRYTYGKNIFCCVHLRKSGVRMWLKLRYSDLESPPRYIRDVSNVGHWGVGDVELAIDSLEKFQSTKSLIHRSFEENK